MLLNITLIFLLSPSLKNLSSCLIYYPRSPSTYHCQSPSVSKQQKGFTKLNPSQKERVEDFFYLPLGLLFLMLHGYRL